MAVISMLKSLAPISILAVVLYAPPELLERYLKADPTILAWLRRLRPILKVLIGLGIIKKLNRALNSLATNNWRISSSPPTTPWNWPSEIAVVTGGCGTIGLALVQGLAAKGVRVAVLDVADPPPELQSIPNAVYFRCDLGSLQQVTETADAVRKTMGGDPSILVNNAGIARVNSILDASETSLRQIVDVNLLALWFTTKQFLPAMLKADKGHVVTVASVASYVPLARSVEYSATKAGALAFHEGLAGEIKYLHKARGVKTSNVHPYFIQNPMGLQYEDRFERRQGMLKVEDVVRPVLAQIFSGRGGQVITPSWMGALTGLRGWPNWLHQLVFDNLSKKGCM